MCMFNGMPVLEVQRFIVVHQESISGGLNLIELSSPSFQCDTVPLVSIVICANFHYDL